MKLFTLLTAGILVMVGNLSASLASNLPVCSTLPGGGQAESLRLTADVLDTVAAVRLSHSYSADFSVTDSLWTATGATDISGIVDLVDRTIGTVNSDQKFAVIGNTRCRILGRPLQLEDLPSLTRLADQTVSQLVTNIIRAAEHTSL